MITLTREEAQQVLHYMDDGGTYTDDYGKLIETLRARLSAPEPEPVADKYLMEVECTKCGAKQDGVLTVTAPPQREWQSLTDEEILGEYRQSYGDDGNLTDVYFARAIEAKLKEKNT